MWRLIKPADTKVGFAQPRFRNLPKSSKMRNACHVRIVRPALRFLSAFAPAHVRRCCAVGRMALREAKEYFQYTRRVPLTLVAGMVKLRPPGKSPL